MQSSDYSFPVGTSLQHRERHQKLNMAVPLSVLSWYVCSNLIVILRLDTDIRALHLQEVRHFPR